jgi:hypothetical protein
LQISLLARIGAVMPVFRAVPQGKIRNAIQAADPN